MNIHSIRYYRNINCESFYYSEEIMQFMQLAPICLYKYISANVNLVAYSF